jgi:hypothetical protein
MRYDFPCDTALNEAKTKVVDAPRDSFEFLVNLFRRLNKKTP